MGVGGNGRFARENADILRNTIGTRHTHTRLTVVPLLYYEGIYHDRGNTPARTDFNSVIVSNLFLISTGFRPADTERPKYNSFHPPTHSPTYPYTFHTFRRVINQPPPPPPNPPHLFCLVQCTLGSRTSRPITFV